MSLLRRTLVWLSRIHRCRGFGIQSPWAYRMVRYVINEHYPYYAYADLAKLYPTAGTTERRLCELMLRLANHIQPHTAISYGISGSAIGDYIRAGCRHTIYIKAGNGDTAHNAEGPLLAVIAPAKGFVKAFTAACTGADDGTVVMLLGIHSDSEARRLWRHTVKETESVVTFDLYYCGLVCFGKGRPKQNYIINF